MHFWYDNMHFTQFIYRFNIPHALRHACLCFFVFSFGLTGVFTKISSVNDALWCFCDVPLLSELYFRYLLVFARPWWLYLGYPCRFNHELAPSLVHTYVIDQFIGSLAFSNSFLTLRQKIVIYWLDVSKTTYDKKYDRSTNAY